MRRKLYLAGAHVDWKHRLLFVHVPKTGGRSIRSTGLFRIGHRRWHTPASWLPAEARRDLIWFGTVRNPWARFVSLWYFFRYGHAPGHPLRTRVGIRCYEQLKHWGDILTCAKNLDAVNYGIWRPLVFWLTEGEGNDRRLVVDKLLRTERLNKDWRRLAAHVRLPSRRWQLPWTNRMKHPPWRDVYTPELRQVVAEHYKDDIDFFGYTFENDLPTKNCPLF